MAWYRKKPIEIEARRMLNDDYSIDQEIMEWCGGIPLLPADEVDDMALFWIPTLEGNMLVRVGDYIIKGVQGEFYPCKADIFEATYDKVYVDGV